MSEKTEKTEKTEKIKVTSAKIVVSGNKNKPYFSIEYVQCSDGKCYLGYGSYFINLVFDWLEECFEIEEKSEAE